MSLRLVPTDVQTARRFVVQHHRHSKVPKRWLFAAGVANGDSDDLVGVAIAGRPVAQELCDGYTLEVTRCCTDGTDNVPSMLYAAMARAAKALGYRRIITYTLESEPGTTLRACGWRPVATTRDRPWHNSRPRYDTDLFGRPQSPKGRKIRWERRFDEGLPPREWPAESQQAHPKRRALSEEGATA